MTSVAREDGTVRITHDGVTLVRYRTATPASKPHVDRLALPPAATPAGRSLVLAAPHDHAWHLGLFFCQKLVDGLNCWEAERERARGRPHGYAESGDLAVHDGDGDGDPPGLDHEVVWRAADPADADESGERLLADRRRLRVRGPAPGWGVPDGSGGEPPANGYLLAWTQRLEAVGRRRLGSETRHGNYSGLSLRLRRSMDGGRVLLPEDVRGSVDAPAGAAPDVDAGPAAPWCAYSGRLDGRRGPGAVDDPWAAGVATFAAPGTPTRWFVMTDFGFVGANPTWTLRTLADGEAVTWRWGVWVHAGRPSRERVRTAHGRYVAAAGE